MRRFEILAILLSFVFPLLWFDYAQSTDFPIPNLLIAIARHESGNNTSWLSIKRNNPFGKKGDNGYYRTFTSQQEAFEFMAKHLQTYEKYKGIDWTKPEEAIKKMGEVYCPDDSEWSEKVLKVFNKMKEDK